MSNIKHEIIKKIGGLSTSVSGWAKYADPQADTSALGEDIDHTQRVAPLQPHGLSEDEVKIAEGKT